MSGKLWTTLLIVFLVFTVAGSIVDASGGINTTLLNGALTSVATTITVDSTAGFLADDYIQIDNEYIYIPVGGVVSATQFGDGAHMCVRGYDPAGKPTSEAASHLDNTKVLAPDAAIINNVLGFNTMTISSSSGRLDMPTLFWKVITVTVPKLILADFSIYSRPPLLYFRYVHQLIALGVFLPVALQFVLAGISAVSNIFRIFG